MDENTVVRGGAFDSQGDTAGQDAPTDLVPGNAFGIVLPYMNSKT
jgi:hypothetical protein